MVVCLFTASIGTANGLSKGDAWNTIIRAVRFYSRTGRGGGGRRGGIVRSMLASHSSPLFFFDPSLLQIFVCKSFPPRNLCCDRKSISAIDSKIFVGVCIRPCSRMDRFRNIFLYFFLSRYISDLGIFCEGTRRELSKNYYTWFQRNRRVLYIPFLQRDVSFKSSKFRCSSTIFIFTQSEVYPVDDSHDLYESIRRYRIARKNNIYIYIYLEE